jgi:plasmid replication initiation protein
LNKLNDKKIEYEDDRIWKPIRLIEKPQINKYSDSVTFEVQPEIYEAILSFSKGFRRLELKTAMEFKSVYSMRFYELLSCQKNPLTYTIDHLKIMFNIEDKYIDRPADFIIKVIRQN